MESFDYKEILPLVGVAVGWFLNQASAWGVRSLERKKSIGRALSVIYFLCLEMIQIRLVQERAKNRSQDTSEWERSRRQAFTKFSNRTDDFSKQIESSINAIAEFYPVEAYQLRDIISKYEFIKSRSLEVFAEHPELYVSILSEYEAASLGHQFRLEKILLFLAFRQSKVTWFRIYLHLSKIKKSVPEKDYVFLGQIRKMQAASVTQDKSI